LDAGLHCLVEKPLAAKLADAEELVHLAEAKNLVLTVGHIERFNPAVQAMAAQQLAPRFVEAHRLAAFNPRGADVAVILDLMIHDIELCLHFIKADVARVDASAVAVVSDTADIANARLTFSNGAVANLTASRISLQPMRKIRLFQPGAYYSLDLAEQAADIYRLDSHSEDKAKGQESMRIPIGSSGREIVYSKAKPAAEDMLCAELSAFVHAVKTGEPPLVSAKGALQALAIGLEIERVGLENLTRGAL